MTDTQKSNINIAIVLGTLVVALVVSFYFLRKVA